MPRALAVFLVFLRLGLTSFGGPIAHIGYFRAEFVERRKWLTEDEFGELVALCQFLPGPASSQLGFAVGLLRAGTAGALLAFVAFTLPSSVLMFAAAAGASLLTGDVAEGAIRGLLIVAVAVVAHAVWGMSRTLTPDAVRALIAAGAAAVVLLVGGSWSPLAAIGLGALAGLLWCRTAADAVTAAPFGFRIPVAVGAGSLVVFGVLLVGLPLLAATTGEGTIALVDAFFRSGALVFGGGHVVLPLLDAAVVQTGWVSPDQFLTGYAAAQAVPGPLFTFATYLGAIATTGPGGAVGAIVATLALFLPGFLLLVGVLPFWNRLRRRTGVAAAMRGASAAVVGILGAALYDPVFVEAVRGPVDLAFVVAAFVLLGPARVPAWAVVLAGGVAGALTGAFAG
ncbi:MAG: chromate efflux transporter [Candidatus Microbacterium phytovorans]|uniref:Chromate efflux transporter n=1 Tax=Candidatus Microbacterium phytovorans TaxID=3121374 RepID=A0AAJ5W0M5_9MICO|nr:chromate efflux transporter [Microbacterium sp.]WEK12362.1 MAG: chromate efflux transporter [Microbacterium sp.]